MRPGYRLRSRTFRQANGAGRRITGRGGPTPATGPVPFPICRSCGRTARDDNKGARWWAGARSTQSVLPCACGFHDRARTRSHRRARNSSASSDEHDPYVHHVGVGGAGFDQVAEGIEVAIGIVVVEKFLRVGIAYKGIAIGDGTGGIGGTVRAVGSGAADDDVVEARDAKRPSQRELLIAAAESFALEGDGGLAAGDDAGWRLDRL